MGNLRPRFLLVDAPCFTCFAQCINATWQYHGSKSAWYIYWPSRLGLELVGNLWNFVEWLYKSLSLFGKFSHVNSMGLVYLPTWKTMNIKLTCGYNNGKNIPYIAPMGLLSTDLLEWFFWKLQDQNYMVATRLILTNLIRTAYRWMMIPCIDAWNLNM